MLKNWEFWALPLGLGLLIFVTGWAGRWAYQAANSGPPDSTVWFIRVGVLLMAIGVVGVIGCLIGDEMAKRQKKKRNKKYDPSKHAEPEQQPTAIRMEGGAKIKNLVMRDNKAIGFSKPMRWLHLGKDAEVGDAELTNNVNLAEPTADMSDSLSDVHTEDSSNE